MGCLRKKKFIKRLSQIQNINVLSGHAKKIIERLWSHSLCESLKMFRIFLQFFKFIEQQFWPKLKVYFLELGKAVKSKKSHSFILLKMSFFGDFITDLLAKFITRRAWILIFFQDFKQLDEKKNLHQDPSFKIVRKKLQGARKLKSDLPTVDTGILILSKKKQLYIPDFWYGRWKYSENLGRLLPKIGEKI